MTWPRPPMIEGKTEAIRAFKAQLGLFNFCSVTKKIGVSYTL